MLAIADEPNYCETCCTLHCRRFGAGARREVLSDPAVREVHTIHVGAGDGFKAAARRQRDRRTRLALAVISNDDE